MTRAIKTLALTLTVVAFMAASASDSVLATENPCKTDIKRLCGDVKPGKGRIQECLKAHENEISPECKQWVATKGEEIKSKLEEVQKACSGDVEKLCKGVKPGQGRILQCLKAHKDEVSPECKQWVATKGEEIKSKLEEVQKACSGDVEKLCKGVEPGEGRIPKCLWQNREKLSPECKASMRK